MAGSDFKDFYRILGVPRSASEEDLRRARRELLKESHPDNIVGDPEAQAKATERSKLINEAFYVLGNQERRSEYDGLYTRRQEGAKTQEYRRDQGNEQNYQSGSRPDYEGMARDWQRNWEETSRQWQKEWEETMRGWDQQYREQTSQFDTRNREPYRGAPRQEGRRSDNPEVKHIRFEEVPPSETKHNIRFGSTEEPLSENKKPHIKFGEVDGDNQQSSERKPLRWEEVRSKDSEGSQKPHIKFGSVEETGGGENKG